MTAAPFELDQDQLFAQLLPELERQWSAVWTPPERLSLSQWSERNFTLSRDYAGRKRKIVLYGWQREPFDAFTDPAVQELIVMAGTQMLKTILLQCALAYVVDQAPGPVLISQPTDVDAATFSKERLEPMIRDNPFLAAKISEAKSRSSSNTIGFKKFEGGALGLVGSNAPGNFARRTIQYFFADEVDKYVASKREGDQLTLGKERTTKYRSRRKIIKTCSPTVDGRSRIAKEYDATDRREPWAPCPGCGAFQVLKFPQVKWDAGRPETAYYQCLHCDARWADSDRRKAAEISQWRARSPFRGAAGFWISHLYSPDKTLEELVALFEKSAGDPDKRKAFVNTNLAELWKDEGQRPEWEKVKQAAEDYEVEPKSDDIAVPERASFLTAAVDFQREWLAIELAAHGRNREYWSLGMWKAEEVDGNGNPLQTSDVRYREWLLKFLERKWKHATGAELNILAMTVDTGERPDPVYELAKQCMRPNVGPAGVRIVRPKTVVPIKGASGIHQHSRLIVGVSKESAAQKRGGVHIVSVGTSFAKERFYASLHLKPSSDGTFPPGYCHYSKQYADTVFMGLASEERVVRPSGVIEWLKIFERNEPLDLHVYNQAAAALVGADRFNEKHWLAIEREQGIRRKPADPSSVPASQPTVVAQEFVPPAEQNPAPAPRRRFGRRMVSPDGVISRL